MSKRDRRRAREQSNVGGSGAGGFNSPSTGMGPRKDPARSQGSGKSIGNVFDALMKGNVSSTPTPDLYPMATGRKVGTDLYRDRGFTGRPAAIAPHTVFQFEGVAKAHWFQSGTVTNDPVVDQVLGGTMVNLYNYIVRELATHKGKLFAIRDTTLTNSGTFNSLPIWLSNYAVSYCTLRALQSALGSGDFNYTMTLIADAINQVLPRLLADLNRIMAFGVPPMLTKFLDRVCGVKAWDRYSPVYIAGIWYSGGGPATDLTNVANLGTILTAVEANTTSLLTGAGGLGSMSAADAQAISNIFGYAYGDAKVVLEKGISFDRGEFMMQQAQAFTHSDSTGVKLFTFPNANVATPGAQYIPFLVPRELDADCARQFFSLLRPSIYSEDALAGITTTANVASQVGWSANVDPSTCWGSYNQAGTFTAVISQSAGAVLENISVPELEVFPWSAEAKNQLTDYTGDARSFRDLDIVWVPRDWLVDETLFLLEEIFLDPLRASGGAQV